MANHLSAIKRHRQSEKRRMRNSMVKTRVKTETKKALATFEGNDAEKIEVDLRDAIKTIDKAASKGVLHHRTASRKIGRLSKRAAKAKAVQE
ncbi:MAG: 30S ribosomal protein S20 [Candidatus Alcyoniella australis]|nr:30S ribosomal protein S20 [Candidatus Alcyoniella australis]